MGEYVLLVIRSDHGLLGWATVMWSKCMIDIENVPCRLATCLSSTKIIAHVLIKAKVSLFGGHGRQSGGLTLTLRTRTCFAVGGFWSRRISGRGPVTRSRLKVPVAYG